MDARIKSEHDDVGGGVKRRRKTAPLPFICFKSGERDRSCGAEPHLQIESAAD